MVRKGKGKRKNTCPYWSPKDGKCTVSGNGLFIPLEDHIIAFCTSDKHIHCSQYKAELAHVNRKKTSSPTNRRKYRRIPGYHQITLHQISESGKILGDTTDIAMVVDLSAGGMQINLPSPLRHDTLFDFHFDSPDNIPPQKGVARVKWCLYERKSRRYFAGLSFKDRTTSRDVSSRFNLPLH